MTETERKLKAGETLTEGFCVYRGDSRDIQPNIDRETGIAFYVGAQDYADLNIYLADKALSILSPKGLDLFGQRWKNASHLTIAEILSNPYYTSATENFSEQEKEHELIRSKGFMNGIATNTADSQKSGFDYVIKIPKPDKDGYECKIMTSNSVNRCCLYKGKTASGEQIVFLAIFRGFDCEVVFFTNIPKAWVNYK